MNLRGCFVMLPLVGMMGSVSIRLALVLVRGLGGSGRNHKNTQNGEE